jgi:hypothetical protein
VKIFLLLNIEINDDLMLNSSTCFCLFLRKKYDGQECLYIILNSG